MVLLSIQKFKKLEILAEEYFHAEVKIRTNEYAVGGALWSH